MSSLLVVCGGGLGSAIAREMLPVLDRVAAGVFPELCLEFANVVVVWLVVAVQTVLTIKLKGQRLGSRLQRFFFKFFFYNSLLVLRQF